MSETPLFQNSDEEEAAYAPQELPEGSAGERLARTDERAGGGTATADNVSVSAALGTGSGRLGTDSSAVTTSPLNTGVDSEIGAAGLAGRALHETDGTSNDTADERR